LGLFIKRIYTKLLLQSIVPTAFIFTEYKLKRILYVLLIMGVVAGISRN